MTWKERYDDNIYPGDIIELVYNQPEEDNGYECEIGARARVVDRPHWTKPGEWLVAEPIDDKSKQSVIGFDPKEPYWRKIQ